MGVTTISHTKLLIYHPFSAKVNKLKTNKEYIVSKKADSSCQYILGISHEIYRFSTGAQNLAENQAVFSGFLLPSNRALSYLKEPPNISPSSSQKYDRATSGQ